MYFMLNGYVKQHWQSEKITKCRDYIQEIELHWKIASFYPESLPYFCNIFAIKHQNYKKLYGHVTSCNQLELSIPANILYSRSRQGI